MTDAADFHPLLDRVLCDILEREGHSRTLADALYVVSVIGRSGLVVLPAEPSPAAVAAVAARTGVAPAQVRAVFAALVAAAC